VRSSGACWQTTSAATALRGGTAPPPRQFFQALACPRSKGSVLPSLISLRSQAGTPGAPCLPPPGAPCHAVPLPCTSPTRRRGEPLPGMGMGWGDALAPRLAAHQDGAELWARTWRCPSSFPSLCVLLVAPHWARGADTPLATGTRPQQPR